jgi:hypothetical protein
MSRLLAQTITELRGDLITSGRLNDALVDSFLDHCADSRWWTETIAFSAVHGRAPGGQANADARAGWL